MGNYKIAHNLIFQKSLGPETSESSHAPSQPHLISSSSATPIVFAGLCAQLPLGDSDNPGARREPGIEMATLAIYYYCPHLLHDRNSCATAAKRPLV